MGGEGGASILHNDLPVQERNGFNFCIILW
jgi:hypothetical protein